MEDWLIVFIAARIAAVFAKALKNFSKYFSRGPSKSTRDETEPPRVRAGGGESP
jgi:hypothetical protein